MRQQLGEFSAALPVAFESVRRAEQARRPFDEGEPLAFGEAFWDGLAVQFFQLRLVIEKIELRRPAGHEKIDDVLGPGREVWSLRLHRPRRIARRSLLF